MGQTQKTAEEIGAEASEVGATRPVFFRAELRSPVPSRGDWRGHFGEGARRLSSYLRKLPAAQQREGCCAALEILAQGFIAARIQLFEVTAAEPGCFEQIAIWHRGEGGREESVTERLDLKDQPIALARLEAGEAHRQTPHTAISSSSLGWRSAGPDGLLLPCLGVDGLLGVIKVEAGVGGAAWCRDRIDLGRGVAEILAGYLERVGLEERLRREKGQVQASRCLAHDLNNLLTVILGYSDLLDLEGPDGGAWREDLEELRIAAQCASELAEDSLGTGKGEETCEPMPPIDLAERLEKMQGLLAGVVGPEVDVVIDVPETLPPVAFDQGTFERVILNLASNARDAITETSGGIGHFRLEAEAVDGPVDSETNTPARFVRLVAHDDGGGIAPAIRESLFEPGRTTKSAGKGHGLGLASVQTAMHESGGRIRLSSKSGPTTEFELDFPIA